MSSRCREKYPQKIAGTFIEPMCQMQGNYRCLTPNPHQGWCGLSLKCRDKKQGSQRELDSIASLLLLWRLWSSDLRLGFSWGLVGQLCPLRYFPVLGMESFFAQALTVCLPAKTVLPLRAPSLFLTTGAKTQHCLPASECGQRGHTRAVSEHGGHLSGVSHEEVAAASSGSLL